MIRITPKMSQRVSGRDEDLKIARVTVGADPDMIRGVQVSAPFGNVK